MITCIQVVQALVSAGYLSDADIEASADVLEDTLGLPSTGEAR